MNSSKLIQLQRMFSIHPSIPRQLCNCCLIVNVNKTSNLFNTNTHSGWKLPDLKNISTSNISASNKRFHIIPNYRLLKPREKCHDSAIYTLPMYNRSIFHQGYRTDDSISVFGMSRAKNSMRCFYSTEASQDCEIDSLLLREKLDSKDTEIYIVDVREPIEIEMYGSIQGSKNIPLDELEFALSMSDDRFLKIYGFEKPPEEGEGLVFYCQVGIRSLHAALLAHNFGYESATTLAGGWIAWKESES